VRLTPASKCSVLLKERLNEEEMDAEVFKNMTRLKQRRVSTQLKVTVIVSN